MRATSMVVLPQASVDLAPGAETFDPSNPRQTDDPGAIAALAAGRRVLLLMDGTYHLATRCPTGSRIGSPRRCHGSTRRA
jgi:hypothetical protein